MSKGSEKPAHARLIIRGGQRAGTEFLLEAGKPSVIGRDPAASIQIVDELMSRSHTRIEHSADTFYVVDLKSSNGTFVNGKRIERAALKTGDSILLGKTRMEFVDAGAEIPSGADEPGIELVDDVPSQSGSTSVIKRVAFGDLRRGGRDAAAREADRALDTIYQVGNLINAESDLKKVLAAIMDSVFSTFKVERSVLFLAESKGLVARIVRTKHGRPGKGGEESHVSRTVVEQCRNEGVSILSSDAMMDDRFKGGDSILLERIRSIMCVPLVTAREGVLGVIYVDNRGLGGAYQERDLELMAAIGKQAGIAIERATLHEDTKRKLTSAVGAMIGTVESTSPFTSGHSQRVSSYAVQLSREVGLDDYEVERIRLTALLHDIGKVVVPREIVLKPGPLTEAEWEQMRLHPVAGARVAASIYGLGDVVEGVRWHHEAFDGSGYPEGLSGQSIPLLARVTAVADAYDNMSTDQPQRPALTPDECIEQLREGAGKQFDPKIAEACVAMIQAGSLVSDAPVTTLETLLG